MKQKSRVLTIATVAASLLFSACAVTRPSEPVKEVDISKILNEINAAISKSIPNDPSFPALSTITLDMQVGVSTSVGAKVPIQVVSLSPEIDSQKVHHVVVDFVPMPMRTTSSVSTQNDGPLAGAIAALYQSVAHASNVYQLKHGSITLQCTFKTEGTAGVSLIPVSLTGSISRQMVQTLTINFGRDPNKYTVPLGGSETGSGTGTAVVPASVPTKTKTTPEGA